MFHNVEQGSDEWFELRLGKITSSHFADIMAYSINKSGDFDDLAKWGESAKKYAMRIALERNTGKRIDTFSNDWMDRGNELEPIARKRYECITFQLVKNGGLIIPEIYDDCATSPDGLIEKGGIEIKCVKFNTHFKVLEEGNYDHKYKWQIHGQIWLAGLEFVDFISYCPEFPEGKKIYIYRIERDIVLITQLQDRIKQFRKLVKEYETVICQD